MAPIGLLDVSPCPPTGGGGCIPPYTGDVLGMIAAAEEAARGLLAPGVFGLFEIKLDGTDDDC